MLIIILGLASAAAAPTPPMPPMLPIPPLPPCPISIFRTLLATNESGRATWLARRKPEQRPALEAKLNEYLTLPAHLRELRLTLTELRWYIQPLLQAQGTQREELVMRCPERLRPLLQERLKRWDQLSPESKQEVLRSEDALSNLVRVTTPGPPPPALPPLPILLPFQDRQKINAALNALQDLPPNQRTNLINRFARFLELSGFERNKTLRGLSEPERNVAEQIINAFEKLPSVERERCLNSFTQFAIMTPEERQLFLANVTRWQSMSAQERQLARNLVRKVPMPPMPALPSSLLRTYVQTATTTNAVVVP
ncbi:MAG: DUF3106 domain-containing protein [Verrucomicrobiota bacterium]